MDQEELTEILKLAQKNKTLARWLKLFNNNRFDEWYHFADDGGMTCVFCKAEQEFDGLLYFIKHKEGCESQAVAKVVADIEAETETKVGTEFWS